MSANVFGGSATLNTVTPVRVVETRSPHPLAWMLDLQVSGAPCFVDVTTGASQTATLRRYRVDVGRLVLPVAGDFVTVDCVPLAVPPSAPFAQVQALLGVAPGSNAPLAPYTATAVNVSVPALTPTTIAAQAGAGRILRNVGANVCEVRIGAQAIQSLAANTTFEFHYAGEFVLFSPLGTFVNVANFMP